MDRARTARVMFRSRKLSKTEEELGLLHTQGLRRHSVYSSSLAVGPTEVVHLTSHPGIPREISLVANLGSIVIQRPMSFCRDTHPRQAQPEQPYPGHSDAVRPLAKSRPPHETRHAQIDGERRPGFRYEQCSSRCKSSDGSVTAADVEYPWNLANLVRPACSIWLRWRVLSKRVTATRVWRDSSTRKVLFSRRLDVIVLQAFGCRALVADVWATRNRYCCIYPWWS